MVPNPYFLQKLDTSVPQRKVHNILCDDERVDAQESAGDLIKPPRNGLGKGLGKDIRGVKKGYGVLRAA